MCKYCWTPALADYQLKTGKPDGKNSVNALTQNYTLCLNSLGIYDFKLFCAMYSCACFKGMQFAVVQRLHTLLKFDILILMVNIT